MKSVVKINIDMNTTKFECESDLTKTGINEIIENVIRSHIGTSTDDGEPSGIDKYTILIEWDFSNDSFILQSNTGNRDLTIGILAAFWNENK
jgi:hypothetical protein